MKNKTLKSVAAGGLLDRRSFILSGLALSSTYPLAALSQATLEKPRSMPDNIGSELPQWMKVPGYGASEYGQPSGHEKHIKRYLEKNTPETSIFSIWHTPIANQRGIITPSGLHFSVSHNGIPDISPEKHQLMIHGLVDKPLKFDIESLMRYPIVSNINFLECAGNTAPNAVSFNALDQNCQELFGQISGSEWAGIPLKYLLQEAGLKPNAKWVIVEGADGGSHARSIPLSKLLDDAIIALYQNGERLRPEQGYPMRLFLPGWEGNASVKWVHRLEVTDKPAFTKDESGLYSDILEDGRINDYIVENVSQEKIKGNIYLGVINRVEPAIEAAFVDIGGSKYGFLPFKDVLKESYVDTGEKKARVRIQDVLVRGQEILVQVAKESRDAKGPSLTNSISLPGRFLVLMSGSHASAVSRKIEDGEERKKLKTLVADFKLPDNLGLIIRTAGLGRTKTELQKDLQRLLMVWENLTSSRKKRIKNPPFLLYQEADMVVRLVRDNFTTETSEILVDNIESYEQELLKYATDRLQEISGIKIYGNSVNKISVISFNLSNHHPSDIGSILDQFGIAVRTGQHCTQPVMDYYNIPGTVRVSLSFYNTKSEIDLLIDALKKASDMLG